LEKSVKPARTMQVMAVGKRDFVIDELVQFIVHVTLGIEVNARGEQRHHLPVVRPRPKSSR